MTCPFFFFFVCVKLKTCFFFFLIIFLFIIIIIIVSNWKRKYSKILENESFKHRLNPGSPICLYRLKRNENSFWM